MTYLPLTVGTELACVYAAIGFGIWFGLRCGKYRTSMFWSGHFNGLHTCDIKVRLIMKLQLVQTLSGHTGRVWNCSWNPTGTLLATCGEDTNIRLWGKEGSGTDGRWVLKTILSEGHTRTVRCVAWSPCGKFLASASFDGTVAIWDSKSGQFECNATLEGHENEVKGVSWAPSGHYLATCSRDKSVWVWEVEDDGEEFVCASVLQAHTQDVKRVIWHPAEDLLASCSYDDKVKMFLADDDDWECAATLSGHESTVWAISFNAAGDRLVSASEDKTLRIWQRFAVPDNPAVWKCVCNLSGYHSRAIYDVTWSHCNDDLIATACGDDAIRIFREASQVDVSENGPRFDLVCTEYSAHSEDVNCVSWHPKDDELLASCSDDGDVKLWKIILND